MQRNERPWGELCLDAIATTPSTAQGHRSLFSRQQQRCEFNRTRASRKHRSSQMCRVYSCLKTNRRSLTKTSDHMDLGPSSKNLSTQGSYASLTTALFSYDEAKGQHAHETTKAHRMLLSLSVHPRKQWRSICCKLLVILGQRRQHRGTDTHITRSRHGDHTQPRSTLSQIPDNPIHFQSAVVV